MAKAEILTIGTELLLGEIIDSNSRYIARALRDHGIDIFWITTVGDNPQRIAKALQQGLQRSEVIITTGGLGPTVDDPTREAAALALGVKTEFRRSCGSRSRTASPALDAPPPRTTNARPIYRKAR